MINRGCRLLVASVQVTGIDSSGWWCLDQMDTELICWPSGVWHSPTVAWLLPIWTGHRVLPSKVWAAFWPQVLGFVGNIFRGCTDAWSRNTTKNIYIYCVYIFSTVKSLEKNERACSMFLKQKRIFFSLLYNMPSLRWEPTGNSKLMA